MRILAIDTSCNAVSACVLDSEAEAPLVTHCEPMARGHAEALAPVVEGLVLSTSGAFGAIDRIAVTVGPGSFTGIRVGLAFARAVGLALERPVVGVSTLVAFAGPLFLELRASLIASTVDARHGKVYFQLFEPQGRPLCAPRIESVRETMRSLGPSSTRLAGNGAAIVAAEAQRIGLLLDVAGAAAFPDIAAIARIGLMSEPGEHPPRPIYVKPPDAVPGRGERIARVDG